MVFAVIRNKTGATLRGTRVELLLLARNTVSSQAIGLKIYKTCPEGVAEPAVGDDPRMAVVQ